MTHFFQNLKLEYCCWRTWLQYVCTDEIWIKCKKKYKIKKALTNSTVSICIFSLNNSFWFRASPHFQRCGESRTMQITKINTIRNSYTQEQHYQQPQTGTQQVSVVSSVLCRDENLQVFPGFLSVFQFRSGRCKCPCCHQQQQMCLRVCVCNIRP